MSNQAVQLSRSSGSGLFAGGAHFTECPPDYGRDEAFQKEYAATARDPEAWNAFRARYLDVGSEQEYQEAVKSR